jgi:CHAT domain-containing protein
MYDLNKVPKSSYFSVILLIMIIVSGCASRIQNQYSSGDHYGIIKTVTQNGGIESASGKALYYLCPSYLAVRKYDTFFKCADRLEQIEKNEVNASGQTFTVALFKSRAYNLKSEAYLELGSWGKAIFYGEKSIDFVTSEGIDMWKSTDYTYIDALGRLGVAYALSGEKQKALEIITKLESYQSGGRKAALYTTQFLGKIKICVALGDYYKAKIIIENYEGAPFYYRIGAGSRIEYEDLLTNFLHQKINFETGNFSEAKTGYDDLLRYPDIETNASIHYQILADRGAIALSEGSISKAIDFYQRAVEAIETHRANINTEAGKIGFVGDKQAVYHQLVGALVKAGRYTEAFSYAERGKARALVDMLASKKQFSGGEKDEPAQLTAFLDKLDKAEKNIIIMNPKDSPQQQANTRSIVVQKKQQIAQADPELASLVTVNPQDVAEIQLLLPPNETIIEYFGSGNTLFVFIVSNKAVRGVKLNIDGLEKKIRSFRENILHQKSADIKSDGQELYSRLIRPIEEMIVSDNLTIVPSGALHYLPFSALYADGQYMIDRYNLRVLPSASVLKFLKDQRGGHAGNLLVFGNPDLGDPTYDLPGAQREAMAITKDQPKSKLLLRSQATKSALKSFGAQFRYIHFAMHGTFDAEKPLDSGLMMAADNENDGMLTVRELYDLHLPADLVTLSACETALGKVANGDDVVGFTRGFLYAGVSSIVSSLWQVDDQATSIMMQQFYQSLKETDKRQALRTAQLKVKDTYNSNPFYWAAFQITGSIQ